MAPSRAKNPDIPAPVDAVLRIALAKAPTARFAAMAEIADELDAYAAPTGVTTGRANAVRRSLPTPEPTSFAPTQPLHAADVAGAPTGTQPSSPPPPSVSGSRSHRWPIPLVAGAAALAVVLGGARFVSQRASAPTAVVPDAASSVEVESQMSGNAGATAAFKAGMQALRDGSAQTASEQLDRAIELDPLFAAAHLRRALLAYDEVTPAMLRDLQSARTARQLLGAHDRLLLDALEPWTRRHGTTVWVRPRAAGSARRGCVAPLV